MAQKKMGYGLLKFLYIIAFIAGILTVIPWQSASKDCMLNYHALCAFTPISTIICFVTAGVIYLIQKLYFVQRSKNVN